MAQASAKRPGILELAARTWRSALGAVLGLLPLCAVVAAVLFGLNAVFPVLEQEATVIRPANTSIFVLMMVPDAWFFALEKLALGLAAVPVALAAQRYVLHLEEISGVRVSSIGVGPGREATVVRHELLD